jgi:hypothetical protein
MSLFRVHLANGSKLDIPAETAANARRIAHEQTGGAIVTKIKIVKEAA